MTMHWSDEDIEFEWAAYLDEDENYYYPIQQATVTRKDIKYLDYYEGWYPEYAEE